MDVVVPPSK